MSKNMFKNPLFVVSSTLDVLSERSTRLRKNIFECTYKLERWKNLERIVALEHSFWRQHSKQNKADTHNTAVVDNLSQLLQALVGCVGLDLLLLVVSPFKVLFFPPSSVKTVNL